MEAYKYLSLAYEKLMADVDYRVWAQYIDSFLKQANAHRIFEAACGIGSATEQLYRLGYDIIASDISPEMLKTASESARKHGDDITFVLQDMRHIEVGNKVDAIVSVCDGPNYIDAAGLRLFAASSYQALNENGILLFDISTRNKLSNMDGQVYFDDGKDESCIWQNVYDRNSDTLTMDITLFIRNGGLFERFRECHKQYAHDIVQVRSIMRSAGFKSVDVFDCFTKTALNEHSQRAQFVGIK